MNIVRRNSILVTLKELKQRYSIDTKEYIYISICVITELELGIENNMNKPSLDILKGFTACL